MATPNVLSFKDMALEILVISHQSPWSPSKIGIDHHLSLVMEENLWTNHHPEVDGTLAQLSQVAQLPLQTLVYAIISQSLGGVLVGSFDDLLP